MNKKNIKKFLSPIITENSIKPAKKPKKNLLTIISTYVTECGMLRGQFFFHSSDV